MSYVYHLVTGYSIAALLALSTNLQVGYCGRITLAQASFFASAAYTYTLAYHFWRWPWWAAILAAVGISVVLGIFLAAPVNRCKVDQFLLVSLIAQACVYSLIRNWVHSGAPVGSWSNLTNGPYGITALPRPVIAGISLNLEWARTLFALLLLVLAAGLCWAILSAPFGRLLKAIRDDDWVVRTLGKNISRARRDAFALAGGLAALGAIVYVLEMTYIDPSIAGLDESVMILSTLLIGGSGNRLLGALCGTLFFIGVPEVLRLFQVPIADPSNIRQLLFGVTLIAMIHLRPQGLAGSYRLD